MTESNPEQSSGVDGFNILQDREGNLWDRQKPDLGGMQVGEMYKKRGSGEIKSKSEIKVDIVSMGD